jgi:hypothetical protein
VRQNGRQGQEHLQKQRATCKDCPLHTQCLAKNAAVKKLARWAHEAVVGRHAERMKGVSLID